MTDHEKEFPFDFICKPDGNHWDSWQEASTAGFPDNQIWSVTEHDGTFSYGPPHHFVNHVYHVVTAEKHDGQTYYIETFG